MSERPALLDLYPKKTLHPRTKIKLQLFPVDKETCMALEKDGYHPHLELTLRARKKITSILNHLTTKWGHSSVARGELVLFPYSKQGSLTSGLRWTLNDCDISAGDVYEAVGRPSIFRLRYGWLSTSILFKLQLQSEGVEKDLDGTRLNKCWEGKESEEMAYGLKSSNMNHVNNSAPSEKTVDLPINSMDNEPTIESGYAQTPKSAILNIDSLTNISMGALLSEASLGKCSNWDSKITERNAGVHPGQPVSDSLDACVAAQIKFSQVREETNNPQHSSILDAEETCHAFPIKRLSSSGDVISSLDANAGGIILQDADFKTFKFPKTPQVHSQSELPQDLACTESKTARAFGLQMYHDDSSLGLSGIKWSESLGPFDLGLPVRRRDSTNNGQ